METPSQNHPVTPVFLAPYRLRRGHAGTSTIMYQILQMYALIWIIHFAISILLGSGRLRRVLGEYFQHHLMVFLFPDNPSQTRFRCYLLYLVAGKTVKINAERMRSKQAEVSTS